MLMPGTNPNQSQVIDPTYHAQLLSAIDEVTAHAGISKSYLYRSATEVCSENELGWLKGFRTYQASNSGGVCIHGAGDRIPSRFMAMAAALVRNYIHARVVSLSDFLDQDNDPMDGTVLFIPNFYQKADGKPLTSWQIQVLYDRLTKRFLGGKMTVVYVEDLPQMTKQYGPLIADLVTHEFLIFGA
jgi:hypothetical protein